MKYAAFAIAMLLGATSVNAAGYKAPAPVAGMQSSGMHISDHLDDSCLKLMSNAHDLRGAVVDFAVSKDAIDTVAMWPLICSPTVESKRVEVERIGADVAITYTNNNPKMAKLVMVFQRVESSGPDDAPAYQIVQIGDMSTMGYEEQTAVKEWLLECYAITVEQDLVAN